MNQPPTIRHRFEDRPHRTLVALSLPVLVSLVAEPLTGLVDTAFVSSLGTAPLAALGVATALFSGVFWVFNFIGIGTQTDVAHATGTGENERARETCGRAIGLASAIGCALAAIGWPLAMSASEFMTHDPEVQQASVEYLQIRLLGGPAILIAMAAFGALRGIQDMRTPLWIALSQNAANIVLDAVLIFGWGPIPAFGIAGAAWASVVSQWAGAVWAIAALRGAFGWKARLQLRGAGRLLVVGRDLFVRTGSLLLFITLATRVATLLGADVGAAHQVIRQFWILTALLLDAFGAAAQSLVGYFLGAGQTAQARRVAGVASVWALGSGAVVGAAMALSTAWVAAALLPDRAHAFFAAGWLAAAVAQPINALAFVTDGIHWGSGDFRFLRNAMLVSTGFGLAALFALDLDLAGVWIVTGLWVGIRTGFGLARIWPGFGRAPLRG